MISVIIPSYNHARYLPQRIESVLQQTFTDFECIILDDASTDNSTAIIERFAASDKRISFVHSGKNSGSPFIQWNNGVRVAKGEYLWIAESDDMADPGFLETMVNRLNRNPTAALAYSQSYRMDENGIITGTWKNWTDDLDENFFKQDFVMNGQKYNEQFLIYRNTIPNASSVLFRKSAYEAAGGANENIRNCSDWLCWLKMLMYHDVVFVEKPLNYFRYHKDSVIARAHTIHGQHYEKEFDFDMRTAFDKWLLTTKTMSPVIKKINDRFIFHAMGNYGLHEFRKGNKLRGLGNIVSASRHPVFTLNFIKRLLFTKRGKE